MELRRYTFLHSDIADSSPSWEASAPEMSEFVDTIFSVIRSATESCGGRVYKSLGDGLACVFDQASDAVHAAVAIQQNLIHDRPHLRIGIHCGEATEVEMDFMGACLNRVSRITNAGHAGQILISEEAWREAEAANLSEITTIDLGLHLTKGHQVAESIRQIHAPHLSTNFPPLRNVVGQAALPRPLTPVYGRETDRDALRHWLTNPACRLITILGFGGIGKTTLAMELGQSLRASGLGRIWWVECENVSTVDQLWQEIRLALGIHDPNFDPCADLAAVTHHAQVVLVLDCFERMASQGAILLKLLQSCPMLRLVVTSRVALDLAEEHIYRLGGLIDLSRKRPSLVHATDLFVTTAQRTVASFSPGTKNKAIIREIVRLVEGIPLAILLAAGRTSSMSLGELRDRLSESILQTAKRTTLTEGRHANLRIVIDASFLLLDEDQKKGLREAAVFRGGFTTRAARSVLSNPDPEGLLASLQGHSLATASAGREQYRFRLLDSVIEYVDEVGDSIETEAARSRHLDFFSEELERFRPSLARDEWREVGRFLEEERGNLAQAVKTLNSAHQAPRIGRFADAALTAFLERGYHSEFESLAQLAKRHFEALEDDAALEKVLGLLTVYARRRERWEEAQSMASQRGTVAKRLKNWALVVQAAAEALTAATESEDSSKIAQTLKEFSSVRALVDEDEESRVSYDSLTALAFAWMGQEAAAQQLMAETQTRLEGLDLPSRSHFYPLVMLGRAHLQLRDAGAATAVFSQLLSRAMQEELPHPVSLAVYGLYRAGAGREWRALALDVLRALPKREAPRVGGFLHRIERADGLLLRPPAEKVWTELARDLIREVH